MPKKAARRKTASPSTARNSSRASTRSRSASDALSLLREDHVKVQKLFKEFEKAESESKKSQLAKTICQELTVHASIEEEIFYPAVREALDEEDLLNEAEVEHASAKDLIAQIESGSADDDLWSAKVTVLGEYINHHVEEEQEEMFPKVRKAKLDLKALGEQLQARKAELTSRLSGRGANKAERPAAGAELQ